METVAVRLAGGQAGAQPAPRAGEGKGEDNGEGEGLADGRGVAPMAHMTFKALSDTTTSSELAL